MCMLVAAVAIFCRQMHHSMLCNKLCMNLMEAKMSAVG
jgi:hypothetical protein